MDDLHGMTRLEVDALREVASIGAGHAATALSQLTHRRIMISVPRVRMQPPEELAEVLGDPEDTIVAMLVHVLGDLTGRLLFALSKPSSLRLCDLLLNRDLGSTAALGAVEEECLGEAGGVVGGAYMNALSEFLQMMLLPSVPSLAVDAAGTVLTTAFRDLGRDRALVVLVEIDFRFGERGELLHGHSLLLLDAASLRTIFAAARVG